MVRPTNGIVNLDPGHLQLQADCTKDTAETDTCPDPTNGDLVTTASQQILDADGNIVDDFVVSTFEFHETHNHWHANNIAQFAVHYALDNGTGGQIGDIVVNDRGEYAIADSAGFFCPGKTFFDALIWHFIEKEYIASNTVERL